MTTYEKPISSRRLWSSSAIAQRGVAFILGCHAKQRRLALATSEVGVHGDLDVRVLKAIELRGYDRQLRRVCPKVSADALEEGTD
jgi:hypothetical protein